MAGPRTRPTRQPAITHRGAAGGDLRRRHEGERRDIGGAEREGDHSEVAVPDRRW